MRNMDDEQHLAMISAVGEKYTSLKEFYQSEWDENRIISINDDEKGSIAMCFQQAVTNFPLLFSDFHRVMGQTIH